MKLTKDILRQLIKEELTNPQSSQTIQEPPKPSAEEIAKERVNLNNQIISKKAELDAAKSAAQKIKNLENELNELINKQNSLGRQ
jgi:hypothetical protein